MSIQRLLTSAARKLGQTFAPHDRYQAAFARETLWSGISDARTLWQADDAAADTPCGTLQQADAALAARQVEQALRLYRDAITELAGPSGDMRQLMQAHQGLAQTHSRRGNFNLARQCYETALGTLDRTSGDGHSQIRACLQNNLALLLRRIDQNQESERLYIEAINTLEESAAPCPATLSMLYNNLGILYQATGHPDEALRMHQSALDFVHGESRQNTGLRAEMLSNRGLAYMAQGRHDLAAADLCTSLRMHATSSLTPTRRQLNVAICGTLSLLKCGRPTEAEEQARLALEIHDLLGEEPGNDLAAIHSILGYVLVTQKRLADAINHYEVCLHSLGAVLIPDAIELADAHFNLALVHAASNNTESSSKHLREAAALMDSLSEGAKERDAHFRQVYMTWFDEGKKLDPTELPRVLLLKQADAR